MIIGFRLGLWLMLFLDPVISLFLGLAAYLAFEFLVQRGGMVRDSLEDSYHVGAGLGLLAILVSGIPEAERSVVIGMTLFSHSLWMLALYFGVKKRI